MSTKLKDILSESKVELGKVYSNPYATAFKPQQEVIKTVTDYRKNLGKVSK